MANEELAATVETGRTKKIHSSWDVARDTGAPLVFLNDQNALTAGGVLAFGNYQVIEARFRFDLAGATVSPVNTAAVRLPLGLYGKTVAAAAHSVRLYAVPWDGVLGEASWYPQSVLVSSYDLLSEVLISDMVEGTTIEFAGAAIADYVNNGAVSGHIGFLIAHTIQFQGTPTASEDTVYFDLGALLFLSDATPVTTVGLVSFESGPGDPVGREASVPLEWDAVYAASVSSPFRGDADLISGMGNPPFSSAAAVVPNDLADLPDGPSFLIVGGPGHLVVQLAMGQNRVYSVLAGQVVQFPVKRVFATGTTATGIKAFR